ncbi:uncharacterized protein LOC131306789 [Rhododendron vialii]|uniref:uncharacterized protein LOC131306789 n=1 Tax=Rhododendron vialii TaxID=182163 RepID=UPI0026600E1D|nr:uncharacterized protein LOC131306789 [Rhododendron vialii]
MLGFLITQKGIEVDPPKIQAIMEIPPPKTKKEVRSFLGKVQFINRFISRLTATCEPLYKLLKKDIDVEWNQDYQRAFEAVKEYLQNPPVLSPPISGKPLILYLSVTETSMGCMLAQENDAKVECAIYYLIKKMMDYETRYTPLEKTFLVSRLDPIKYLFEKPALIGKLARRLLLLAKFDLKYMTRKSVKGRVVAEFLADHPITEAKVEDFKFTHEDILFLLDDTWQLYFDGASNQFGYGIGVLLVSPNDSHISLSYKLRFEVTNNQAEYEACIAGMEVALELGARRIEVIRDSNLVVSQARGDWKVKADTLKLYHSVLETLIPQFDSIIFTHTPRVSNRFANALATLASMVEIPLGFAMWPLMIEQKVKLACECTFIEEGEDDGKPSLQEKLHFTVFGKCY